VTFIVTFFVTFIVTFVVGRSGRVGRAGSLASTNMVTGRP
jgi:hypothetical protein